MLHLKWVVGHTNLWSNSIFFINNYSVSRIVGFKNKNDKITSAKI
jgi:hypothetical protein